MRVKDFIKNLNTVLIKDRQICVATKNIWLILLCRSSHRKEISNARLSVRQRKGRSCWHENDQMLEIFPRF